MGATFADTYAIVGGFYLLLIIVPIMSLTIRRLNDAGYSKWWAISKWLLKISFCIFSNFHSSHEDGSMILISIFSLIILGIEIYVLICLTKKSISTTNATQPSIRWTLMDTIVVLVWMVLLLIPFVATIFLL